MKEPSSKGESAFNFGEWRNANQKSCANSTARCEELAQSLRLESALRIITPRIMAIRLAVHRLNGQSKADVSAARSLLSGCDVRRNFIFTPRRRKCAVYGYGIFRLQINQGEKTLKAETAKHKREANDKPDAKTEAKIKGDLKEFFSHGKRGETNGFKLDSGLEIHFPPHLANRLVELMGIGDEIEVDGEERTNREGVKHIKPHTIANITRGATLAVKDFPPPHEKKKRDKEKHDRENEAAEIVGEVLHFKKGKHGETKGLALNARIEVRFPPHLSAQIEEIAAAGERIKVAGRWHTTPKGDLHFHAETITNERTGDFAGGESGKD
jgi:hypothetical protein